MSIRIQTTILTVVIVLITAISLNVLAGNILLGGFDELESRTARKNVQRVQNALSNDLDDLNLLNFDWAAWDDTYQFITDGNEEYIESNLVESTFANGELNIVAFVDLDGKIVFGTGFDLEEYEMLALPEAIDKHLTPDGLLNVPGIESNLTGIVMLDEQPLLVSVQPIRTSELEGPMHGYLVMGRYLDANNIAALAERTQFDLSLFPDADSAAAPADVQTARSALSTESPSTIRNLNSDSLAGYTLLTDIYGQPALVLKAEMPREIYQQGQETLSTMVAGLAAVSLVSGLLALVVVEFWILRRLSQLSEGVAVVAQSGERSARVPTIRGKDELSFLAKVINDAFAALEQAEKKRAQSEMLLKEIHHRVNNNLQVISGLLSLQAMRMEDTSLSAALKDSKSRVEAMALVHKKLYSADDLSQVVLSEYVQDLLAQVTDAVGVASNVKVEVVADDTVLLIDQAIPVGMILNELMSNAFKHAFPDHQAGNVKIELAAENAASVIVRVSDDGVGLPAEMDIQKARTLGLQLVTSLTKQLQGTVEAKNDTGTTITITFPLAVTSSQQQT